MSSSATDVTQLGRFKLPSFVPTRSSSSPAPAREQRARPHASTYSDQPSAASASTTTGGVRLSLWAPPPPKADLYRPAKRSAPDEQEDEGRSPFAFHPPPPLSSGPAREDASDRPMRLLNARRTSLRPSPPPPPPAPLHAVPARRVAGGLQTLADRFGAYRDPKQRPRAPEPAIEVDEDEGYFW